MSTSYHGGDKMKKKWKKPELLVLYRGRSEEWVLKHCKRPQAFGPGVLGCQVRARRACQSASSRT